MTQVSGNKRVLQGIFAFLLLSSLLISVTGCTRIRIRREMHEANQAYKQEDYPTAIEHYKTVTELDPGYAEAWLNMGFAYRALYRPGSTHEKDAEYAEKGIEAYSRFLDLVPESEEGQQYFLEFCTSAQKNDEAIAFFKKQLEVHPDNPQIVRSIANLYAKKGDVEDALMWFDKWTQVEPENPESWYTIGVACWEQSYKNKFLPNDERRQIIDRGMAALGKALELKPDYFDALSYMNLIYREKSTLEASEGNSQLAGEDYETAQTYMKKALEVRNAQLKAQAEG